MKQLSKLLVVLALFLGATAQAQEPIAIYDHSHVYREGSELFDHEKYAAAMQRFDEFIQLEKDPQNALRINAEYYSGICALYLFHKDAEYRLEKFVREHPDSPWKQHVYFELATFNFKKKSFKKALEWFEFVDEKELSAADRLEFRYKRGFCYFERGDNAKARTDFYEVKDSDSEFAQAALYYYSHIAYEQGDLETALQGFQRLDNDPAFKPIVPFYITQIYYKQKRYDDVIAYAPAVLDSAKSNSTKRVPEIARLIGDSWFIKEKYAEAIPYLEQYHQETAKSEIPREDYYQLGYAYYRTSQFQKAIDTFSGSAGSEDELGQLSTYNIADCYLKLEQKEYARNAFGAASKLDFNKEVQEDAMFNYAKLAFELSYNPFHEAITAFEDYLEKYPDSRRRDEAYEFLLNVYMKTRNYERALASLDKIKNKDVNVQEAYQVVAYNRGVELFQSRDYANAEKFFDRVSTYPVNQQLIAESKFWKAEIAYNMRDYGKARDRYNTFLKEPGAFNSEYYGLANYGLGYTYFKMANDEEVYDVYKEIYSNANTAFRKFADAGGNKDPRKLHDAWLRIGDCFYVTKSYAQAIQYYDKVADADATNRDYALFQKAMAYGFDGQNDKKSWVLKTLLGESPDSRFEADAKYELAKSYRLQERFEEAKTYYNDILKNHSSTPYAKRALLDLCLIYVNQGNSAKVKETWNQLYTQYPNDKVLVDAVAVVKSTLIEDPEFQNQIRNMHILNVSDKDIEDEVFAKASDPAYAGDCDAAIQKINAYLTQFNPAFHGVEAHFLLAECYFSKGQTEEALESYTYVIDQPLSDYSEESLKTAATICYNKKDYTTALGHYSRLEQVAVLKNNVLEGQIGVMRCNYFLGNKDIAVEYANKVLTNASTPEDIRTTAYLWRGRVRMDQEDWVGANSDFKEVLKKGGLAGAEAKYSIAYILYRQSEWKKSETEIFQLVEKYSVFEEWKYKGFLLLSDVYVGMKDYFQARTTLNAILNNVNEQWVRDEANAKLAELDALENGGGSRSTNEEIEIDLQNE